MLPTQKGSFRLFRFKGIDVFLHWSWFILAFYSISTRIPFYHSAIWGVAEYLSLFLIVLMHEFGHALACRQVGGTANEIVLWPFGGVAYVAPPQRPGATLWSIAAGPLVNVALVPVTIALLYVDHRSGWITQAPDLHAFIRAVTFINGALLAFNLLPVYPLDGGQILRSLLWFPLGKARSLFVATIVGFLGGIAFVALAVWQRSLWTGFIAAFLLSYCWRSFQQAQALLKIEKLPRRPEFACPVCRTSPPIGNYWRCQQCNQPFDMFEDGAICPHCSATYATTVCPDCGSARPLRSWDKSIRNA